MLDDRIVKRIGEYLQAYRKLRKMSLRDLSERCGISKSTISRYEAGMDGDIDKYDKICRALGVDFNMLVIEAQHDAAREYLSSAAAVHPLDEAQIEIKMKEQQLLQLFREVNEQSQNAVISLLEAMPKGRDQNG